MQLRVRTLERCVALVLAAALIAPNLASATPVPTTPTIDAKRAEAVSAQEHLDELQAQLELRSEEYAAVTEELQRTRDAITTTREELRRADQDLGAATVRLQDRAVGIYRTGSPGILEVLLDTTSFSDFLTRMDWLRRVGRNDAQLVAAVKSARQQVVLTEESLKRREAEQIVLRDKASVARREVESALAAQASYVKGLNAEVSRLVAEERARQEALAAERAARAAEAARLAAATSGTGRTAADPGTLGPGHPEVVQEALVFVGKVDYLWGGTTPAGFDCSGLTQYCYARVGVTIPRTSRSQFKAGDHIAADRLDMLIPGDLVFFGYGGDPARVHHVGIYVGSGDYVHAPGTGEKVTVSSLTDRIATKGDYVGASRF